jgi:hypothetical protein
VLATGLARSPYSRVSKVYVKALCTRSRIYLHAANRENVLLEAIQPDMFDWCHRELSHHHEVMAIVQLRAAT